MACIPKNYNEDTYCSESLKFYTELITLPFLSETAVYVCECAVFSEMC